MAGPLERVGGLGALAGGRGRFRRPRVRPLPFVRLLLPRQSATLNDVPSGTLHGGLADLTSLLDGRNIAVGGGEGRWLGMRVLVAFEELYRTYREMIAASIRVLRPHLEVTPTGLHDLEGEVARRDTRVVISSQERLAHLRPGVTWIEVPLEAGMGSDVTLETLLEAIDKAETPPARNPTVKTRRSQAGWPPNL